MQNISLTKIANAVRRLESDNARKESYLNLVSQHEAKLQELISEIQKLQSNNSNEIVSELTDAVNEIRSRSINTDENKIDEVITQFQELKSDVLKAINDGPVLTYDERSKNIEADDDSSEDDMTLHKHDTVPEFTVLDIHEPKYSDYGSLNDVLQINLGETKISIDKDEKDREICSITNEVGGLAFRKQGSDDVWLMNRTNNSNIEFHFNTMDNTPISINPQGVKMSKLWLNGKRVSGVATSINNETINDKTIPTVSAMVKYVNANLQRMNLLNKLTDDNNIIIKNTKQTTNESISDKKDDEDNNEQTIPSIPHCNISTINTSIGKSLLIENETNSFSLKDDEFNIISISASLTDGLRVGDKFKLNNNVGTLCKFNNENGSSTTGRFVELTGSVIKINDLIIPEVRLTNKLTTMVYGIIDSQIQNEFVKENKIYKLDNNDDFVSVIQSGIIEISIDNGSFELGSLLVAGKSGIPVYTKNNTNAVKFCVDKKVPMVKVISKINDNLVVEVIV